MDELSFHVGSKLLFLAQTLWRRDLGDGGLRGCNGSWLSAHVTCVVFVALQQSKDNHQPQVTWCSIMWSKNCFTRIWYLLEVIIYKSKVLLCLIRRTLLYLLVLDIISFRLFVFCCLYSHFAVFGSAILKLRWPLSSPLLYEVIKSYFHSATCSFGWPLHHRHVWKQTSPLWSFNSTKKKHKKPSRYDEDWWLEHVWASVVSRVWSPDLNKKE